MATEFGSWIAHPTRPALVDERRPTVLFRSQFTLAEPPRRAVLWLSAHGVVEAFLAGKRVGRDELVPGFTEYAVRTQRYGTEVTELVGAENELVLELSDGWFAGAVGMLRARDQWGEHTAVWAELELEYADRTERIVTDGSWHSAVSAHHADMIHGEFADLRAYRPGATTGLDWQPVRPLDQTVSLLPVEAEPVRITRQIAPTAVRQTPRGWLVDFGENIAGGIELDRLGPAGNRLRFVHGEVLDSSGEVTQANITPDVPFLPHPLQAGQVDEVISAGDDAVFRPRHSTKGFRYVRIEGELDHADVERIRANVFHSHLAARGSFTSSSDDLNWLFDATKRSFLGNAIDIPTDCPTRERAGWTADWDIFFPTASFMFDVSGFTRKWLRDLAARQWDNGIVGNMAPMPRVEGEHGPIAFTNGSAGWGDAIVSIPWVHFQTYGDSSVLREFWPDMERWLGYVQGRAEGDRHASRVERSAEPAAHERFIWDTGFQFGEWFEPDSGDVDFAALSQVDQGPTATAFYRKTTSEMAQIAELLGLGERAVELRELSANIRDAWRAEFLRGGQVQPARQAHCVRALAFDLLEPDERASVAEQLAGLVREADGHLGTGFLATPHLLPTLAEAGYGQLAWRVLTQRDWPSWLRMRDLGATTVWERWEGYDEAGEPIESHNHYSKGAVTRYLFEHIAGLRRVPGRQDAIVFAPEPPTELDWAEASHALSAGEVRIRWQRDGDQIIIDTVVPVGVSAELLTPNGERCSVTGTTRTELKDAAHVI